MLCFKGGNLSWHIYYVYEGNSRFNPVRLESVPYIIDRLPCAEAVKAPAYVSNFVVESYDGLNCCNGSVFKVDKPIKFNGDWAINCMRIHKEDLESIAQILAGSGNEYYIFPKEIDTLVIKKTSPSSNIDYANVIETNDEKRYWFGNEEDLKIEMPIIE